MPNPLAHCDRFLILGDHPPDQPPPRVIDCTGWEAAEDGDERVAPVCLNCEHWRQSIAEARIMKTVPKCQIIPFKSLPAAVRRGLRAFRKGPFAVYVPEGK